MTAPAVGYTSGDHRKANRAGDELTGPLAWTAAADSHAVEAKVTGDSVDRFAIEVDGSMEWGPGNGSRDVNLYRGAADVLRTDDQLHLGGTGSVKFGSSGDVDITRTGGGQLTLDGDLIVTGTVHSSAGSTAVDDLAVADDATIGGDLAVTGITTLARAALSSNLTVAGSGAITGALTAASVAASGAATVGSLSSSGAVSGTNITGSGNLTVAGSGAVTGALSAGSAAVSGAVSAGSVIASGVVRSGSATIGVAAGNNRDLGLSSGTTGAGSERRWVLRADNTSESGSGAGSNLRILAYDDAGSTTISALSIERKTGNVGLGTSPGGNSARCTAVWGTSGDQGFSAQPSASPGTAAAFNATMTASGDRAFHTGVSGDSAKRYTVFADGKTEWGSGAANRDTNLYRSAADTLKTDDSLVVAGSLSVGGRSLVLPPPPLSGQYLVTAGQGQGATNGALAVGRLRLAPWLVTNTLTLTRIGAEITTLGEAGSKLRLGIYADDGSRQPGALVLDAGQIAGDGSTGAKEITISQVLTPGLYWIGGAVQSVVTTQPTIRVIGDQWTPPIAIPLLVALASMADAHYLGFYADSVTGALPSTFTAAGNAFTCPRAFVRLA